MTSSAQGESGSNVPPMGRVATGRAPTMERLVVNPTLGGIRPPGGCDEGTGDSHKTEAGRTIRRDIHELFEREERGVPKWRTSAGGERQWILDYWEKSARSFWTVTAVTLERRQSECKAPDECGRIQTSRERSAEMRMSERVEGREETLPFHTPTFCDASRCVVVANNRDGPTDVRGSGRKQKVQQLAPARQIEYQMCSPVLVSEVSPQLPGGRAWPRSSVGKVGPWMGRHGDACSTGLCGYDSIGAPGCDPPRGIKRQPHRVKEMDPVYPLHVKLHIEGVSPDAHEERSRGAHIERLKYRERFAPNSLRGLFNQQLGRVALGHQKGDGRWICP